MTDLGGFIGHENVAQPMNAAQVRSDRPLLICEDLFLLLTKPTGAPLSVWWSSSPRRLLRIGMVMAVIADAIAAGCVTLTPDKRPRVVVLDTSPTGVPAIDRVVTRLMNKNGQALAKAVSDRHLDPTPDVVGYLMACGIVGRTDPLHGGLSRSRYPLRDPSAEYHLRDRLRSALRGGPAGFRDITLLAIVQGLGLAKTVFPLERAELSPSRFSRQMKLLTAPIPVTRVVAGARESLESNSASAVSLVMCPFFVLWVLSII